MSNVRRNKQTRKLPDWADDFEAEAEAMVASGEWDATIIVEQAIRHRADEQRDQIRARFAKHGGNPTWPAGRRTTPDTPQRETMRERMLQRETKKEQIVRFLLSPRRLRDERQTIPTPIRRSARAPRRRVSRTTTKATAGAGHGDDGAPAPRGTGNRFQLPRADAEARLAQEAS
jgi:hypothetical protein